MSKSDSRVDKRTDRTDTTTSPAPGQRRHVPVAGGTLVYEGRAVGKELVGFADITDYEAVADALRTRGHGTGALHHLPEVDK